MGTLSVMVGYGTPAEQVLKDAGIAVTYGDTKIAWDSTKSPEVDAARATFDKLVAKGYLAFGIKGQDKKGDRLYTFDPDAERITLIPPVAGG